MKQNILTKVPKFARSEGIRYRMRLNACIKCHNGVLQIQERLRRGRVTETEAYCQNCGKAYYGTELRPAAPAA